jgi:uncharacterized cupredoxin-like copper-binding protein
LTKSGRFRTSKLEDAGVPLVDLADQQPSRLISRTSGNLRHHRAQERRRRLEVLSIWLRHFGRVDVKRTNCLPYLMELSYACVWRPAPYSVFGPHCRSPAGSTVLYRLAKPRRLSRLWFGHEKRFLSNQEIDVQKLLLPMIGILTTALACGCNSAKSPAAVAIDVAAARQQASTEVTDATKNVDSAAANAESSSKDLNDVGARTAYDVAVAQADGDHNVAIQQCLALTGEAQKSCKERADAGYDQAKTHANVTRLSKLQ